MKCLFLFRDAPLSPNYTGGSSRYYESFMALSRLGVDVHVCRMLSFEEREKVLEHEKEEANLTQQVRSLAVNWEDIYYSQGSPLGRFEIIWKSIFNPIEVAFKPYVLLKEVFWHVINCSQPDFIWAEHVWSAALVCASQIHLPWIYAHHDWLYKIAQIRKKIREKSQYLSQNILEYALRSAEMMLIRQADGVITGSKSEAMEIQRLGARYVQVIPTTYPPAEVDLTIEPDMQKVRIIHLGGLTTTANWQGLLSYLEQVHPHLVQVFDGRLEFVVVGNIKGAKYELMEKLQQSQAILTGHVNNLSSVLRPYDIAIIPYEMNTGTRTKLGSLFNHAQVVIATQAAVAGSEEVQHGVNCLVLPSLEEFPTAISMLAQSPQERKRIGQAARNTFEKFFMLESQLPRFRNVLVYLNGLH